MTLVNLADWAPDPNTSYPITHFPLEVQDAYASFESLVKEEKRRASDRRSGQQPPPILHHYTSLDGLLGIVLGMEIWLSDYRTMNDPTEGIHSSELFGRQAVSDCPECLKEHFETLYEEHRTTFKEVRELAESWTQRYVASFTPHPDHIYQWVHYGCGGEGVCVGIDSAALKGSIIQHFKKDSYRVQLYPVIYDSKEQRSIVDLFLKRVFDCYLHHKEILKENYHAIRKLRGWVSRAIQDAARIYMLDFKSEHYKDEGEWRCVVEVSDIVPPIPPIRVSGSRLRPYCPLPARPRSVIVGPKADYDNIRGVMRGVCMAMNMQIIFERSAIPLR